MPCWRYTIMALLDFFHFDPPNWKQHFEYSFLCISWKKSITHWNMTLAFHWYIVWNLYIKYSLSKCGKKNDYNIFSKKDWCRTIFSFESEVIELSMILFRVAFSMSFSHSKCISIPNFNEIDGYLMLVLRYQRGDVKGIFCKISPGGGVVWVVL